MTTPVEDAAPPQCECWPDDAKACEDDPQSRPSYCRLGPAAPAPVEVAAEQVDVERLRALGDVAGWADGGWKLPGTACIKIARLVNAAAAELITLRQSLARQKEAYEADAERLNWLESHKDFGCSPRNTHIARASSAVEFSWHLVGDKVRWSRGDTVRAAIDAARIQAVGEGKA